MTNETVDKIEDNIRQAQNLLKEAAKLLCNEPEDTPGGAIWSFLVKKSEEIVEPLNYTYKLRD